MKNAGGRPTKLTKNYINAAKEVLGIDSPDSISAIIYTDKELFELINDKLPKEEKICDSTFDKWKAGKVKNDKIGKEFLQLIKKALSIQKEYLFQKFQSEPMQWQKWAWILERKFSDWNIRKRVDVDVKSDGKELKQLTEIDQFFQE